MGIPLLIPDMPDPQELLPYLKQMDLNKQYTNFGPLNQTLENRLVDYLSAEVNLSKLSITTVANATLGLELVYEAFNLPRGSTVLTTALTFPATATALVRQGLQPLFADIDPESWLLTPTIARAALTTHPSIKLIVVVAAFGLPVDTEAWDAFVEETGIPVVVDAAGAFGNQRIGNHLYTVFSLHATKALGAGEGGFIATTNADFVKRIKMLSSFGMDVAQGGLINTAGTNAKLSEYHAAVALAALDRWSARQSLRIELINYWLQKLQPLLERSDIVLQKNCHHYSLTLFPVCFKNCNIERLSQTLLDNAIQTRRLYYPLLTKQPAFAHFPTVGQLPNATDLSAKLLGLPFHLHLAKEDIHRIVSLIQENHLVPT